MKSKFFKLKLLSFCMLAISNLNLKATQTISMQSGVEPFPQDITAKAFDRYTGTLYLGTDGDDGTDKNPDFSVCKAERDASFFTPLTKDYTGDESARGNIEYMALVNNGGKSATHVAVNIVDSGKLKVINLSNLEAHPVFVEPGTATNDIIDASNRAASGLTVIAGSQDYLFARVLGANDNDTNSGFLAYNVNGANPLVRINDYSTTWASTLDYQIGTINSGAFLRFGSYDKKMTTSADVSDIYWDKDLQTLFIAGKVTVKSPEDEENFYSAISKLTSLDNYTTITLSDVLTSTVNVASDDATAIFASSVATGLNNPRIHKIRTMKTSTENYYLIVNGGIDIDDEVGSQNQVWALRYNPATGHVVANDSLKTELSQNFVLHDAEGHVIRSLDGQNEDSLKVGGEDAPWDLEIVDHNPDVMDMEVVGDTVYVSVNGGRRVDNDPGVWASQAMFDDEGVIIGWSKWERVFPAINKDTADSTRFFAVDAYNNKLWQVSYNDDSKPRFVKRMKWDLTNSDQTSLVYNVSSRLSDGCKVILDLPVQTPGLGEVATTGFNLNMLSREDSENNSFESIALFGGFEKVVFARTEYGSEREVTTDFSNEENILTTNLPSGAGVVRSLGYSRVALQDQKGLASAGYFYAGTDTGLYVYAKNLDKTGFKTTIIDGGLTTLQEEPFDGTFSWQKISNIGPVSAIDSDGENVYFVEQDITSIDSVTSKLYRMKLGDSFVDHDPVIIAQSGVAGIPANTLFTGFKLVTDDSGEYIFGIISTNLGIFKSNSDLTYFDTETDVWVSIDSTLAYHSLYAPKRVPSDVAENRSGMNSKVIGITLADNPDKLLGLYNKSKLYQFGFQIGGLSEISSTELQDANYTNSTRDFLQLTGATRHDPLRVLDRTTNFWTDGGRRLFTRFDPRESKYNTTVSFPFYADEWAMTKPVNISDIDGYDNLTTGVNRIHCFENISGIGILAAGTDSGIIALE